MDASTPATGKTGWPNEGFQWKKKWLDMLPTVRSVNVPDAPEPLLEDLIVLGDTNFSGYANNIRHAARQPLDVWDTATASTHITHENLAQRDVAFWVELLLQTLELRDATARVWAIRKCIALHGLAFAVEVLLAFTDLADAANTPLSISSVRLRLAIAQADETSHEEAIAVAERLRGGRPGRKLHCSYLFAHRADWSAECVRDIMAGHVKDDHTMLWRVAMPPERFLDYMKLPASRDLRSTRVSTGLRDGTLLQVKLHGEAAFDVVAQYVRMMRGTDRQLTKEATALAASFRLPAILALLGEDPTDEIGQAELAKLLAERKDKPPRKADAAPSTAAPSAVASETAAAVAVVAQEAPPSPGLPAILVTPPWLSKARATALPTLALPPIPSEEKINFTPWEQETVQKYEHPALVRSAIERNTFFTGLRLTQQGADRLLLGEPLLDGDVAAPTYNIASADMALAAPEAARLALWNSYPAKLWADVPRSAVRKLLTDYGGAAIPGLVNLTQVYPFSGFEIGIGVDSQRLVEPALQAFRHHRRGRPNAQAWLQAYPRTALLQALPLAFQSGAGKTRDNARHGLRWLIDHGHAALAREVAAEYGPAMTAALDALLNLDPLLALPTRMPALPEFVASVVSDPPLLRDGTPVPASAAGHILSMLAISKAEAVYPGIALVRKACNPASLARFADRLFEAWVDARFPPKENWAFAAVGLLGNDQSVRNLVPYIKRWPSENGSARAVAGLEVLSTIGSDLALLNLDILAAKARTPALRDKAREKIEAIAEARDLSREQLADRLVPRMGLDEDGAAMLDFGPRKFELRFDEALRPMVRDASGKRLKDLPKPLQSDDAALAADATVRFKQVKKDAKQIATQQLQRMEQAMVQQRRWSAAEFQSLFLGHPVMRHLAAGLAWAVFREDEPAACFRVAEDWTLADAADTAFELPADAAVGIPHPVEIEPDTLRAMQSLFSDYEVIQPFKQLARETFTLTPEEAASDRLTRFADRTFVTASVLGLANRSWSATGADSGGWVSDLARQFGDLRANFIMVPGTIIGNPLHEPKQRIPVVELRANRYGDGVPQPAFGQLGPVQASEVLRDFELLPLAAP